MPDLSTILSPVSVDAFLSTYWTNTFLHVPGPADKFATLYSWEALNSTLNQHRFGPNRLGMMKNGRPLEYSRYLTGVNGQVDMTRTLREFADGATLILNGGEEAHPVLRDVCASLEAVFAVDVTANVYAVMGPDNGFDVHWDEQDTLILQVSGRKRWKVWPPTRRNPFRKDVVDTSPATKPDAAPAWDMVLEQGHLLSIPRGWWHLVSPIGDASLHLTVTIKTLTGIDMLHWLADQMKVSDAARMSLPLTHADSERREWLCAVRDDVTKLWEGDLLMRYVDTRRTALRSRPGLTLPDTQPANAAALRQSISRPETTGSTSAPIRPSSGRVSPRGLPTRLPSLLLKCGRILGLSSH